MLKKYLIILVVTIIVLVGLYLGFRGSILHHFLDKVKQKAEASYGLKISYRDAGFVGFKSVYISGLNVKFITGDTVISGDSVVVNPKLIPLLLGEKRLKEVNLYNTKLLLDTDLLKLIQSSDHPKDSTVTTETRNYAQALNKLQSSLFTFIPSRIVVRNSGFYLRNDSINSYVTCENFSYEGDTFLGELVFADKQQKSKCMFTGRLDKSDHTLAATLSHTDTSMVKLPFLQPLWSTLAGFDTLHVSMTFDKVNASLLNISGAASASDLAIKHKRIGPDVVMAKHGGIGFTFHVGNNYVELDSSSTVTVNKFSFSPYFRFEHGTSRKVSLSFVKKEFSAQKLFESFPSGLFNNFKGIKTSGNLAYHMKMVVDLDHPDSVLFDSQLENKGFKVDKYGVTDFRMLNGQFIQEVYENDRYVTSILVGPDNVDFVPLDQISPYFKYSVLTSEDGDFYYHHGFNERAFRESIATNLKEKRFARGGSTISMQLVKNVFLSRNKTISRKIEEALIVWMIENLHLVSKDRMFEVYLNIMELGPGVYGIKPAARFYFKKSPANLSLNESIYLSSIIPRPKGFRYTFDENGQLRDYLAGYFKLLSGIMVKREQISPMDTINLKPSIKLTGEARKFLAKPDSIAKLDSLFFKEFVPGNPILLNEE